MKVMIEYSANYIIIIIDRYSLDVTSFPVCYFTTREELVERIAFLRQHSKSPHSESVRASWRRAEKWVRSQEAGDGKYALLLGAKSWEIARLTSI